jgi:hypothetical protein
MSLFSILADFIQPYVDLVPRVEQRPASNEWLVVDSPWRPPYCTRYPTLHAPWITHVERYPAAEYPIDCGYQSVTTADMQCVTVNATAIIVLDDPVTLREQVPYHNWEEWTAMTIRGCVEEVVSGHNLTHLQGESAAMIKKNTEDKLSHLSVYVESLVLEDFTLAHPFRLFGHLPSE